VWKRPVLLGSIGFLLFLTLWLPERVLFVSVDGYASVSPLEILNAAQQCGIRFGATRSLVRSEEVKNALLDKMPSLQWVGVNTKGCVAILSVREKQEEQKQQAKAVSSLVAIRDGIVITGTATAGELRCKPGQVVRSGEVLVSGYTDCGISVRAEKAKGEIFALTVRPLTVVATLRYGQKGSSGVEMKKFSLIIGKKRINLSKDSGISYTSCDKIRDEYVLTLPGGFALPVTLLVDTYFHWDAQSIRTEGMESSVLSENTAKEYLVESMIAGEILDVVLAEEFGENVYILEGNFLCSEMIARERNEEILEEYGKNRGENR
jgi:sporulation protein YqfD